VNAARRRRAARLAAGLSALLALVSLHRVGLLDPGAVRRGFANVVVFAGDLFPPATEPMPRLAWALLETVEIAFAGTALGFLLALPAASLAARNLCPPAVTVPVRFVLDAVRTVPSLLWAIVFVVAFGLGPAAGALGIAAYTLGYLGKLLSEVLEGVDDEVLEAVASVGCGRAQLLRFALLPEAANGIVSQLLFVFEYNVRASSILGFVGAGGIGFYMMGYLQLLQYRNLMAALVLTLALVVAIDAASAWLRRTVL
jgi:phosphonate transport system permease protein